MRRLATWFGVEAAADYLGCSPDKIEIYAFRWPQDNRFVPGRLRWKHLPLKPGSEPRRRYYRPDLDAFRDFAPGQTKYTNGTGYWRPRYQVRQERKKMTNEHATWLSTEQAASYLGVSRDTIEEYRVEWPKDGRAVPGKWRFKKLPLKPGGKPRSRHYRPDLDAALI